MSVLILSLTNLALCHVGLLFSKYYCLCTIFSILVKPMPYSYLDRSKAFDTISHVHLLDKLASIDIASDLWCWFRVYLTNIFQYVSVKNHYCQLLPVESGVPQGSILGPLLFIVYVNDLPDTVLHSNMLLFADDTKCFRHIKSQTDQQILQTDLLSNWSTVSHLSLNPSKSVHISKFSIS